MRGAPEREHPLLGAGLLLVPARAPERGVIPAGIKSLLQRLGLHDIGMDLGAVAERPDAARHAVGIDMDDEIKAKPAGGLVAEPDHFLEFPRRIHMQKRERRLAGSEGLHRQMQHHGGVLADGIQHHRIAKFGRDLANDVDAFRFQPVEMGEPGNVGFRVLANGFRTDTCRRFGRLTQSMLLAAGAVRAGVDQETSGYTRFPAVSIQSPGFIMI